MAVDEWTTTMRPLGFTAIEQRFHAALKQQSVAHAWLLHGPSGIGKAMLARALAADALCLTPTAEGLACTHCHACRMMDEQTHPDFFFVQREWDDKKKRAKRDISIAQIRELCASLAMSTHERDGMRVVVIDAVDELNVQAANALLKTLEEPLPGSLLLLVCHDAERLLPTIRSRCLMQACHPLKHEQSESVLQRMGLQQTTDAIHWAAGRPGLLLALRQEKAMQSALELRHLCESLADADVAQMQSQLTSCCDSLPHTLIVRVVFIELRFMLQHIREPQATPLLDAMDFLLRWPEDVRLHSLRPAPSLFARMLSLRSQLRLQEHS